MKVLRTIALAVAPLGVAAAAVVAVLPAAGPATAPTAPPPPAVTFHQQVEADRAMTQRMATDAGPGMIAGMPAQGMLGRSMGPAYLRTLERHAYEIDRMLARTP